MSAGSPVTLRDIAVACGLHPSTVCLALKNAPSIPRATRQRIQAAAETLGYRPNVAARNLALLRLEKNSGGVLPIAWINQEHERDHWHRDPVAHAYFTAAQQRATQLGYHLEEIWTRERGITPARVVQILQARGIAGVLFPVHQAFDFSLLNPGWGEFSLVGFNDQRLAEWVDVVCPDHYANTRSALRRLRLLGYSRIGLVLAPQLDAATGGLLRGSFLRYESDTLPAECVPICFVPDASDPSRESLQEWLEEQRPDAVLGCDAALVAHGREVLPNVAWIRLHGALEAFDAGIEEPAAEIAVTAVDCVVEKMRRFDRGLRELTRVHLIKGQWREHRLRTDLPETVVA